MNKSVCSRASNASSKMLEELANRSMTAKILRVQGSFNDEQMRVIWNALGLYISRNLRMGRGVNIPKFGIFTFTPPEVRLKGVTNQNQRDQKPRLPVFLIQKDFVKGLPLKTAVYYHQDFGMGLRPYTSIGTTGDIPITKMNILQIASYANTNKDAAQLGVNRIIKYISQKFLSKQNINIDIPNVGQLISKNNLVAVKFNEFLHRDTRTVLSKSLDQRKKKGNMNLTVDNLKKFALFTDMQSRLSHAPDEVLQIDDKTKDFLRTDFGLHFHSARNPMKNSLSEFSRTFATREQSINNNWLKISQMSRMSNSGFSTGKVNSFSRQYNMALKLVKQWVLSNCQDTENSFKDFCQLSESKNEAMSAEDVWSACRKISLDINEQQSQELFRLLDANKDGFVTKDDWKKNIAYDTNKLIRSTIDMVRRKKYKPGVALEKMGLAGISRVDVHTLKSALQKLNQSLSDEQAIFLSRYITKGKSSVEIENILEILQLADSGSSSVDEEWELRFLQRFKKKTQQRNIYEEELQNKFNFYDRDQSGYIDQMNFKNVLADCGITLNLSELAKIVKIYPLDSSNRIRYGAILDALQLATGEQHPPISYEEFVKILKEKVFNQSSFPYPLPISVRKLANQLQATFFKNQSQKHLLSFVKKMDVNKNDEINEDDIKAYRQLIRQKKNYLPEHSCQLNMEQLLIQLRERSIKKKISFYDLFNKLDKNRDGFISREEWMSNLDWILNISQDEKELLFDHMDCSKLKMIDYTTFLSFMKGLNSSSLQTETFDWVQDCLGKIKKWFGESKMTSSKAFKLIDQDGDSYISEKDLQQFLEEKLKYQPRQMSHVRLQKILKVMDSHKRGKVDEVDWDKFLQGENIDWISDAQQQVGIILSKQYSSLSEAFYSISEGDKRLVYNSFKKWAQNKKAFSGFIPNQSVFKQFFSAIDTHKKGYLTENDFISVFGQYNWKSEQTKQFFDKIKAKFSSAEQAFKVMNIYSKSDLNLERFSKFVTELFGNRFKKVDIKNIWANIAGNERNLPLSQFLKRYGKEWTTVDRSIDKVFPQDSWKYEDFSIIKGTTMRSFEQAYDETQSMQAQTRKIVNTIKELLAASPKSLQQAFQKVDTQKVGRLNNIQFKKAIRSLNIALTSKELDLLLNYCDYKVDTLINWREFMKRFDLNSDEQKILSRIEPKMQLFSDLLHYYMVSPKDAFMKWNNPRTGYMNFEEFLKMVRELYHKAAESLPQLSIIKQFFEHIDVRKDNQLDFQEFSQTFRIYRPPSLIMGTVPANNNLLSRPQVSTEPNKPIRDTEIPEFKSSPQYEEFVKFISRNRKYLQQKIQSQFGNSERLVPFEKTSKIIQEAAGRSKKSFSSSVIRHCIAFSMTGDKVDYRLLLENCKERGDNIVEFPLTKVF